MPEGPGPQQGFINRNGPRGGPGGPGGPPPLPADYLKGGYFDGKYVRKELLTGTAVAVARSLGQRLTTNQFRRFYDHARALERKLELLGDYQEIQGDVAKMVALAAAAVGRGNAPAVFKEFMEKNVYQVDDEKSFRKGFLDHMEAVLAFHGYLFGTKGGRGR